MSNSETMLKKHMCIPFLDTNKGASNTYTWARIDKSTIFALNANPQTETQDYICYEMPMTEIDHYEPELPQEIVEKTREKYLDALKALSGKTLA